MISLVNNALLFFIYISIYTTCSNALLQIPQFIHPNIIMNLESIVTTKAITSSIINNLKPEFTLDKIALQLTQFNYHSTDYFYISIFITYLYGHYQYMKGSESCLVDTRLTKFDNYQKVSRLTKDVIFIIFIIFTKDIQNAI